jgi:hypothetical protein
MTLCIFASGFVNSKLLFEEPVKKFIEMVKYRSKVKNILYSGNINGLIETIFNESLKHEMPITHKYSLNDCDLYVALPGGIGTICQIIQAVYCNKHILIYNIDGFYDNFINYLNEIQSHEMVDPFLYKNITIVSSLTDVEEWLNKF